MDAERIVLMSDHEILKSKDLSLKEIIAMKELAAQSLLPNGFQNGKIFKFNYFTYTYFIHLECM